MAEETKSPPVQLLPPPTQIVAESGGAINEIWYRFFQKVARVVQRMDALGISGDGDGGGGGGGTVGPGDIIDGTIQIKTFSFTPTVDLSPVWVFGPKPPAAPVWNTMLSIPMIIDPLLKAFSFSGTVIANGKRKETKTKKLYARMRLIWKPTTGPEIVLADLVGPLVKSIKGYQKLPAYPVSVALSPAELITKIGTPGPGSIVLQMRPDSYVYMSRAGYSVMLIAPRAG